MSSHVPHCWIHRFGAALDIGSQLHECQATILNGLIIASQLELEGERSLQTEERHISCFSESGIWRRRALTNKEKFMAPALDNRASLMGLTWTPCAPRSSGVR